MEIKYPCFQTPGWLSTWWGGRWEGLLPADPGLSMLAVTFTYSYRVQAEQEFNHKWLILYSIAYYVTIFTDIIDHSYFTGYSKSFNCWTFISSHLAR